VSPIGEVFRNPIGEVFKNLESYILKMAGCKFVGKNTNATVLSAIWQK
jgi:hypothetical protein